MNYRIRVNGKVIEESAARSEVERRAQSTWLKAQAQGLRVEIAEAGTQNFRPLDQFLSSAPPVSGDWQTPPPASPKAPFGGSDSNNANSPSSTERLSPSSFNNPPRHIASIPSAPIQQVPVFPPPAAAPVNYPNYSPQNVPAMLSSQWVVVAETNRLDPALRSYIRPEHYGHNGPWLVRNYDLVPIAGFWICNAARNIDGALVWLTFGIYLFFMCAAIAQGRQTLGQKLAGVRMVRQDSLALPSVGQFLGSMVCIVILALIPLVGLLLFAQAFTEKKQGLNHMLCRVMHVEEQHYGAGRGIWLTLLGTVVGIIMQVILFILLVALLQ